MRELRRIKRDFSFIVGVEEVVVLRRIDEGNEIVGEGILVNIYFDYMRVRFKFRFRLLLSEVLSSMLGGWV